MRVPSAAAPMNEAQLRERVASLERAVEEKHKELVVLRETVPAKVRSHIYHFAARSCIAERRATSWQFDAMLARLNAACPTTVRFRLASTAESSWRRRGPSRASQRPRQHRTPTSEWTSTR